VSQTARGQQGRAYTQEELENALRDALAALTADGTTLRELTVNRIVAQAGVARSTFYLYFADKAAMISALGARSLEHLYVGARSWIRLGGEATRADIAAGMRQILDAYRQDEPVMRLVAEASAYERSVHEDYVRRVDAYARALERMIRKGIKAGRMRAVDPAPTATALAWMTEGTVRRAPARLDAVADALADVVWQTLFAGVNP
jgi:AcrR family transcriptional regulator